MPLFFVYQESVFLIYKKYSVQDLHKSEKTPVVVLHKLNIWLISDFTFLT